MEAWHHRKYRTISHLFGVGISTPCSIVHEVCKAIVDSLLEKYINIPPGNAAMDVVRGFEEKWGFPQYFLAVDGSHIPTTPLHALVDHENRFMNVNVGWPGSVHDARIFSSFLFFRLCF